MENKEIEGILENLIDDVRKLESALKPKHERRLPVNINMKCGSMLPPSSEAYLLEFNEAVVRFEINRN